ncbi:hypothetical protein ASPCAL13720 [Aspergillus calidoustus]|uniref:Acyl-CoA desaturase n=1 Tax=Aspergillus calidoustus TaxID=454130 RepID=A0A0U5GFD7_ASPCI|nr:hypothetical protein ASPCAL13720 [Aspergillus calidoustus]
MTGGIPSPSGMEHWHKQIWWAHLPGQVVAPLCAFTGVRYVPIQTPTLLLALIYGLTLGFGITLGYHRLWAHRSFRAHVTLRVFLAAVGAGNAQRSIKWWVTGHRAHHRYLDTDLDPYNARKGLLHSHVGWLLVRPPTNHWGVDISDLESDAVVMWQDRYFIPLSVTMCLVVPALVSWMGWGDFWGGLLYAGLWRMVVVFHCTFTVNSLAHWAGQQPFSRTITARDNRLVGLLALGEGYHNFHHEFPMDYRCGFRRYDLDMTKWVIRLLATLGLATHLHTVSDVVIQSCREPHRGGGRIEAKSSPSDYVPVIDWEDYTQQAASGRAMVAIAGFVYDITEFVERHPGGEEVLRAAIGRDATAMFYGGVFSHSVTASSLLSTMCVYVIRGGGRVEIRQKT